MTLAEKFNVNCITEQFIEDMKDSIKKSKFSEHINERTRMSLMATEIHGLAMGLYLLDKKIESFNTVQNVLPVTKELRSTDSI